MNETVILADELCRQPKPSTVQACNRFNCAPAWYPAQWQQAFIPLCICPYPVSRHGSHIPARTLLYPPTLSPSPLLIKAQQAASLFCSVSSIIFLH
ncbi:hypothetical protein P7K49_001177 [Saguinus oedipus]|uniref:Uncharacterized protein n=1 Tax=Saguinus oedipus TaxID=9490 RepID=A0ABQ9WDU7_SAGOE|nr:hypothetical protein P7K49_001177 [Saguinus oedipus]